MTVVHLMRHGEVHNPQGVLYGRLPGYVLSERGHEHARAAADYLRGRDVTVLLSSPLERAQQTAKPLADDLGLPVVLDERLIEADNRLQGRRVGSPRALLGDPRVWVHLRNPLTPSWGEPYVAIAERMMQAVRAAAEAADGHEAVCVSHQLPIVTVRRLAEGKRLFHDPRRRQCALGSITSLTLDGRDIVDVEYAQPSGSASGGGVGA